MSDTVSKNLGVITAYGMAVQGGYTGTKQQFYATLGDLNLHTVQDLVSTTITLVVLQPNKHYHYGALTRFTLESIVNSDYETTFEFIVDANGCQLSLPANVNQQFIAHPIAGKRFVMSIKNRIAISVNLEPTAE